MSAPRYPSAGGSTPSRIEGEGPRRGRSEPAPTRGSGRCNSYSCYGDKVNPVNSSTIITLRPVGQPYTRPLSQQHCTNGRCGFWLRRGRSFSVECRNTIDQLVHAMVAEDPRGTAYEGWR